MTDISEKIRSLRADFGLSQAEFAERIGVTKSKIQNIEGGKQRADHEFLTALAVHFTIDLSSFLTSDDYSSPRQTGGMAEASAKEFAVSPPASGDFVPIPRYSVEASAGHGAVVGAEEEEGRYAFSRRWLSRRALPISALAVISVTGSSMEPRLSDGDLVLIDTSATDLRDGVTYVFRLGNDLLIKQLQIMPLNHVKLISLNSEFEPLMIHLNNGEDFQALGRVVASMHEW